MLGKVEFRVLQELDVPRSRREIAKLSGYTPKTVSRAIESLEHMNLITRGQVNGKTMIRPAEAKCVEMYHSLVAVNSHIDFPELLSKNMLVLLYYLDDENWMQVSSLRKLSGLSRSTIYRHLKTLRNRAIVMKDQGLYRLRDSFGTLNTFSRELFHQDHRAQLKKDGTQEIIIWESHDSFLIRSDTPITDRDYQPTGLYAFEKYGLHFLTTSEHFYYYSEREDSISPADLVCHLLLIENDSRNRQYALLLVAATETSSEEVRARAEVYEMTEELDPLLEFLDSRGRKTFESSPPWEEFKALADEYGVSV